jgi:hypothetical protein
MLTAGPALPDHRDRLAGSCYQLASSLVPDSNPETGTCDSQSGEQLNCGNMPSGAEWGRCAPVPMLAAATVNAQQGSAWEVQDAKTRNGG